MTIHDAYRKGTWLISKKIKELTGETPDPQEVINLLTCYSCYRKYTKVYLICLHYKGKFFHTASRIKPTLENMKAPKRFMTLNKTAGMDLNRLEEELK